MCGMEATAASQSFADARPLPLSSPHPPLAPAPQWLEDNTPYNPKESEERQAAKAQRELRTWLRNMLLIVMEVRDGGGGGLPEDSATGSRLCHPRRAHTTSTTTTRAPTPPLTNTPHPCPNPPLQAVLQVPSVLALLWYTAAYRAGSIHYEHSSSWAGVLSSTVAIYFYLYAGSALLFQAVGFMLPPNRYLQLAAALNLSAVLVFLWSLYVPQVRAPRPGGGCLRGGTGKRWDGMAKAWVRCASLGCTATRLSAGALPPALLQIVEGVYLVLSVCASAWVPMASFIFLDREWWGWWWRWCACVCGGGSGSERGPGGWWREVGVQQIGRLVQPCVQVCAACVCAVPYGSGRGGRVPHPARRHTLTLALAASLPAVARASVSQHGPAIMGFSDVSGGVGLGGAVPGLPLLRPTSRAGSPAAGDCVFV